MFGGHQCDGDPCAVLAVPFTYSHEGQREERELFRCDWCKPVFNRKATCNIWLRGGAPATWSASHCWDSGRAGAFKERRLSAGLGTKLFLCINSLRLHNSSVKQGTVTCSIREFPWGHTAKIKILIQNQAPEFMLLTRYSAQRLPTHHMVKKSRLLIYTLTYLGEAITLYLHRASIRPWQYFSLSSPTHWKYLTQTISYNDCC